VDRGREIFSKRLFEGPEQRFPQREVVASSTPRSTLPTANHGSLALTRLMQIVNDRCEHGYPSADLNAYVLLE
jgi:hypothetical protein